MTAGCCHFAAFLIAEEVSSLRSVCDAPHALGGGALNQFRVSFLEKELSNFSYFPFIESTFLDAVALASCHLWRFTCKGCHLAALNLCNR